MFALAGGLFRSAVPLLDGPATRSVAGTALASRSGDRPAAQARPQPHPAPTPDTLTLSGTAAVSPEANQENFLIRAKKKAIRAVVRVFGGSRETADKLAEINPYDLIVKGGKALGMTDERARRVATNTTNAPFMRWAGKVGAKVAEAVPQHVVNRTIAKSVQQELAIVLPQAGRKVTREVGKRTVRAITRGVEAGKTAAEKILTQQGRINRAIKVQKPAVEGIIKVVRSHGVKAPLKMVQGKLNLTKEAIHSLRREGARMLVGKPTLESIRAEGNVVKGLKRALRDTYARSVEESLQKGVEKGSEKALEKTIAEGVVKTASKTEAKALEKAVAKATGTGIAKAAEKGAVRIGARLAGLVPVIGAVAEGAITAYDGKIAYDIHTDPKASNTSAIFADITVALDGVSTGTVATGWLAPVGWVASGLSIVTGLVRDVSR